jgi:hypothetical protein
MNGKLTAIQRRELSRMGKSEVEQPTITGDLLSDLVFGWAQYTTERLQKSLLSSRMPGNATSGRASMGLYQSLAAVPTTRRGNEVVGKIQSEEHYQWVDGGRGPTKGGGSGQLVKALRLWIADKGIPIRQSAGESKQTVAERNTSLAIAIARKIHTKGYKGNKFFSKIINDATFEEFAEYLGQAMGAKIAVSFELLAKQSKEQNPPF